MCKLSVIMPVYNTCAALPRCLDSILGQGFADFELLLVDDGSTDGSGALCDRYAQKDSRVSVFHKPWGGTSSARNVGLDHATGEWITFIDSDDFVDDGYFTLPYDTAIDLYVRNWRYANGNVAERFNPQVVDKARFWAFMQEVMHSFAFRTGCSFFYKRASVENNGIRFDERFHLGEDSLFVLDYFMHCHSLQTVAGAAYRYDRSEQWESKHVLPWQEAETYLAAFVGKYDTLPIEAPELAFQIFGLFRELTYRSESHMHRKWLRSKPVKRFVETQIPVKGQLFRLKYWVKEMCR